MACSLFNIDNNTAMQVVGVGFVIGVIQDSAETALSSSTDVLFTAAVDQSQRAPTIPEPPPALEAPEEGKAPDASA